MQKLNGGDKNINFTPKSILFKVDSFTNTFKFIVDFNIYIKNPLKVNFKNGLISTFN